MRHIHPADTRYKAPPRALHKARAAKPWARQPNKVESAPQYHQMPVGTHLSAAVEKDTRKSIRAKEWSAVVIRAIGALALYFIVAYSLDPARLI